MKKFFIILALCVMAVGGVSAQSMSDEQVMKMVLKEKELGTSSAQIVTKLMQKGVNIEQIRRVRRKAERLKKNEDMGASSSSLRGYDDEDEDDPRMRTGKNAQQAKKLKEEKAKATKQKERQYTQNRLEEEPRENANKNRNVYDYTNQDWVDAQEELSEIIPDTALWLEKLLAEKEMSKRKKVFGRDIFNNDMLTFEPNLNIATPKNYRLGPGDAVFIDVYGASSKTIQTTVSPDGVVTIDGFGPISVSGLTVDQANQKLRSTLGSRYSSSKIRLSVGETRAIMVNVMGNVKTPGTFTVSPFASVFHALYMAGGVDDLGTLRNIKVFRNNQLVSVVDIYDYILNGRLTGNVRLADNDVVIVGAYESLVSIEGKVKRPMYYEMKRNETLADVIRYAGGFTGDAYKKTVRLIRRTGREFSVHSVDEFDMASFRLTDADSITVDSIISRYSNMVEIKGAVFRPGMYQVDGSINSVRALLTAAEGLKEEAFTAHAVMHRMKDDRSLEALSVDIKGIMDGTVPDIPLRANDVLFVPTKSEMMKERTISIHGEVHFPGVYKYAENETIEDFVLQAGGLKETASTVKVDVSRRVSNPSALTSDSLIARTYSFALKEGFVIDGEPGFRLMPFDEVYVRKSPGFFKQQNVDVEGEVMFGGTYTLSTNKQRLSDVIKAAGGLTNIAYARGARLERKINDFERIRMETVLKKAVEDKKSDLLKEVMKNGTKVTYEEFNKLAGTEKYDIGNTYYVGIELDKALQNPGSEADIILREGDRIVVPEYVSTVKVNGEVMYPNTVGYVKGKKARYYIDLAGGYSGKAKKSKAYIIYMNGRVSRLTDGARPQPGCEIVIPSKSASSMSVAEMMSLGTGAASIATMIATIANLIK
ncbi:MAG: SLBB domain-containing protein [Bacteroidaceae bacterium]|nr:SLBB domain-containing protein [Bacteroidaceae bacterium]